MNIKEKLAVIQQELNVPKSKPNRFGGYKYRNVDMIVAAVKPLLKEQKCILTLNDEVVEVGGRVYVKATAVIEETDGDGGVGVNGWAREQLEIRLCIFCVRHAFSSLTESLFFYILP